MSTLQKISNNVKATGIILILFTGLLNFHPPHFLLEFHKNLGNASPILEFVLLVNVICAIVSAVGIYKNKKWAWILGILIACISFLLWLAQETIGLPGLPKMWLEPSRIVSLVIEGVFVVIAYRVVNRKPKSL